MSRIRLKRLCLVAGLSLALVILWIWGMPYPIAVWRETKVVFDPAWGISEADFKSAQRAVRWHLGLYEVIMTFNLEPDGKVTILTLLEWKGPLNSRGRVFELEKCGNAWIVTQSLCQWFS